MILYIDSTSLDNYNTATTKCAQIGWQADPTCLPTNRYNLAQTPCRIVETWKKLMSTLDCLRTKHLAPSLGLQASPQVSKGLLRQMLWQALQEFMDGTGIQETQALPSRRRDAPHCILMPVQPKWLASRQKTNKKGFDALVARCGEFILAENANMPLVKPTSPICVYRQLVSPNIIGPKYFLGHN